MLFGGVGFWLNHEALTLGGCFSWSVIVHSVKSVYIAKQMLSKQTAVSNQTMYRVNSTSWGIGPNWVLVHKIINLFPAVFMKAYSVASDFLVHGAGGLRGSPYCSK